MSAETLSQLSAAIRCEKTIKRFYSHCLTIPAVSPCLWFIGAISGRGHGRFWIGKGCVVIAHRFAWALAYGDVSIAATPQLAHQCDNPLCVNVAHLDPADTITNTQQWSKRRLMWSGPLADPRGARARAIAIRDGLRNGTPLRTLLDEGANDLERGQLPLF
ncbi:hypothetical protein GZ176_11730 [Dermatophilus congolensis]|uniref:hypothetical protein n=1 Tax=Dermatophilus congolensis TaxID=1863 RepID=UPI001AAF75D4|nr:hypothetical protein [Dermatophilus congolensis]MBO3146352.1 hypothetical protein [Dermatophilus congolensis]MBO3148605.1 hypothetical protein [Dermatophilus congolensis]MBO3157589.1 hypothetical protein [Dermatophilus congolensis]MBO3159869.1 hypothetical protein [Dermatophilus congolensis]MBO3166608.1 hypothetical protein [Dermatophilus congolensis]